MFMSENDFQKLIKENPNLAKSYLADEASQKKNKYKNVKLYEYSDGMISEKKDLCGHGRICAVYDSEKEYKRWTQLQILEKAGEISNLERQKVLLIQKAFIYSDLSGEYKVGSITYKADYFYEKDGKCFVEDVKPFDRKTQKYRLTKDFVLKWKLLMYKYPSFQFVII